MNAVIPAANYNSATASIPPSPRTNATGTNQGKKILIVDDSVIILKALSAKLRANGYQVFTAVDGSEAVSTVRRERPNLILLDINFPPDVAHGGGVAWDGLLIMSWLRRMDEALNTPVIIITGSDSASSLLK
jgi:CheY-like chemotaxis protein